ncbi:MAG: leucyl/phenylalanyl-tRNA--protein transferase [Parasphingorhabdus sp.]|jgi:leucyl/phenylalanyl-tRNA--protein transferase
MRQKSEYISDFPPWDHATDEGLLAIGGDLSPDRLIDAYSRGIFPWFNPGQPILWWSPDPRMVLHPAELKISRSLKKTLRRGHFSYRLDSSFAEVIHNCAAPRKEEDLQTAESYSWITQEMITAYCKLYEMGLAHSVETWQEDRLVGGLYGVEIGGVFFGESMFSLQTDSSKCALVCLCELMKETGVKLVDCQVSSEHLSSLGARAISRELFSSTIREGLNQTRQCQKWEFSTDFMGSLF